jgi:hypothetical protein
MSTQSYALKSDSSQVSDFPHGKGSCKHCGRTDLFLDQRGQHFGYFCRACGRWQGRWVKHSEVRRLRRARERVSPKPYQPVLESIGPANFSPATVAEASNADLAARVEKLERAFAGYDLQLGILVKAILACGVLQGCKVPPLVNVSDELVDQFVREVSEDE